MTYKALIFDTETTGLIDFKLPADDPAQPRIASIAGILTDIEGNKAKKFLLYVKPDGWEMSPESFAVNGLTTEFLSRFGKPIEEVLAEYDAFVDECNLITAYGLGFDQKCIRAEQRRAGRKDRYGERDVLCLMSNLFKCPEITGRVKLIKAVKTIFDEDMEGAHDAMVDVEWTHRIYQHMLGLGLVIPKPQVSKK